MSIESFSPPSSKKPRPEQKIRIGLVDVSDLKKKRAYDISRKELDTAKGELKWYSMRKIWKYNLARTYYENRARIEAEKRIDREGTTFTDAEGASDDEKKIMHQEAVGAIVDRFTRGKDVSDNRLIRDSIGETKDNLQSTNSQAEQEIRQLALKYGTAVPFDSSAQTNFARESETLLKKYKLGGSGVDYANNLLEAVHQIQQAVLEGVSRDQLDKDIEIVVGKAKAGIESRVNVDTFDRIIDKCRSTRLGASLANEATITLAVASALHGAGTRLGMAVVNSKVMAVLSFGGTAAVGALWAAKREATNMKKDRAQHMEQRARGGEIDPNNGTRRQEMEKTMYATKSAEDLMSAIRSSLYELDAKGSPLLNPDGSRALKKGLDQRDIEATLRAIADAEKRSQYTDAGNIFMNYSGEVSLERERTNFLATCSDARDDIQALLSGTPTLMHASSTQMSKSPEQYMTDELDRLSKDVSNSLDGEMALKDRIFEKMKNKSVRRAGGIGFGVGLLFGSVVQEAYAAASDSQVGLVDILRGHHVSGESSRSFLAYLFGGEGATTLLAGGATHNFIPVPGHTYTLPSGVDFTPAGGTYNLTRGGDVLASGITFEPSGELTNASKAILAGEGILPTDVVVPGTPTTTTISADAWANAEGTPVHREFWYDNNTPKPKFEENELRLQWGGNKGAGPNGEIVLSVKDMIQGRSVHAGNVANINPFEKLKVFVSVSQGTQMHPVMLDVLPNGDIVIDPATHPEVAQLFHKGANGKMVFDGKFVEVAEVHGSIDAGKPVNMRPVATLVGDGSIKEITTTIPGADKTVTTIPIPVGDDGLPGIVPPPIPVVGRSPLEKLKYAKGKIPSHEVTHLASIEPVREFIPGYYYGSNFSPEEIARQFEAEGRSFDSYERRGKEFFYKGTDKRVERNISRERERIRAYLDAQSPEYRVRLEALRSQITGMDSKCRLSINIPARMEALQLEGLLNQYLHQTDKDGKPTEPSLFEVNVLVNRKESEQPDKSVEIIQKWQAAHPEIKVNLLDIAFADTEGCVGLARKMLTDISLMRSLERTSQDGPLYIETEDADVVSMDRRMVAQLVRKFDESPEIDVLRGIQDRQPEILQENALLFFSRRMSDFSELALRNPKIRSKKPSENDFVWNKVISGGWNTAYTAETYAQVGGYDATARIGEDMEMGKRISILRGDWSKDGTFDYNVDTAKTSGLRANSSPRRYIQELLTGTFSYDVSSFEDQSLKTKTIPELMESIKKFATVKPEHLPHYQSVVTGVVSFIRGNNPQQWIPMVRNVLRNIGLREGDYEMNDEGVVLRPEALSRIEIHINNYKQRGKAEFGYRRQTSNLARQTSQEDSGESDVSNSSKLEEFVEEVDRGAREQIAAQFDEVVRSKRRSGETMGGFLLRKLGAFATFPIAGIIGASDATSRRLERGVSNLLERARKWQRRYPQAKEGTRVGNAIARVEGLLGRKSRSDSEPVPSGQPGEGGRENRQSRVPEGWVNRIRLDNVGGYARRGATPRESERQQRLQRRMTKAIFRRSFEFLARSAGRGGSAMTVEDLLSDGGLGSRSINAPDLESNPETAGLYRGLLQLQENFERSFRDLRISDGQIKRVTRSFEGETIRAYVERLSSQLIMAKDGYDQKRKQEKA